MEVVPRGGSTLSSGAVPRSRFHIITQNGVFERKTKALLSLKHVPVHNSQHANARGAACAPRA